ncbi:SH3 domain-containing protein [Marivita sp. XM-24bin2]|uniref:SH3 domain-containing protein n=1 Tax=unclassified Marivita TaxID=2632480 RepID=UPI000D7B3084|nr:SH3 domain-containing protein [Marivita sp. XM-24bin2]MCR9109393.1 SH3 domain-containing protein [Paracoccaceae bacterium]PWL35488.1 MAG: aspartyl-trna synthetase [Marivita sp. XM-24bin2]
MSWISFRVLTGKVLAAAVIVGVLHSVPAFAAERGAVTNLPLPRYVSMKASEGNVRRGPSLSHRIDWVYKRRNMPLQITAEHGHWRRVQDRDGAGGWVHYSLLSGVRTAIVEVDMLNLYVRPDPTTQINAQLSLGVVAEVRQCQTDWCELEAGGYRGWARKGAYWGVQPNEVFE